MSRFEKEKEKGKKLFTILVALFILSIMVASVLNFGLPNNNQEEQPALTYNSYDFYLTENGWMIEKNGKQIITRYNPKELEQINIPEIQISSLKLAEKIYVSLDINKNDIMVAAGDFIRNLELQNVVTSCPSDFTGCEDLPLKTCNDATDSIAIIQFNQAEIEIIQFEGNCLFIQAPLSKINMITDKIIYKEFDIL